MKPLQLRLKMIVFKITIKWNLTQSHAISFCCSSFILRVALLYQMSLYLADFNDCFFFSICFSRCNCFWLFKLSTSLVITAEVDHQLAISQFNFYISFQSCLDTILLSCNYSIIIYSLLTSN